MILQNPSLFQTWCVLPKNIICREDFNQKGQLQSFKNDLAKEFNILIRTFFLRNKPLGILTKHVPITKLSPSKRFISNILDQVWFTRQQI